MSSLEAEPLLSSVREGLPRTHVESGQKRHIGIFSAMFVIFNRVIGTGIFATPAVVLTFSGSVGMSLLLWVIGALIAVAGMQVYIVWGTALPRNGGEKNYLEYLFPYPKNLITCVYAASVSLMAWAAGNSLIFGEYFSKAIFKSEPTSFIVQLVSLCCVTFALLLHGTMRKWGLRLQNLLGAFKLFIVCAVIATGYAALRDGIPAESASSQDRWRGRRNFHDIWEGTSGGIASLCTGLYSVIWSFIGFSNANYALSEVHNPARTMRVAGHLALALVATFYILSNLSYFVGASKEEIIRSRRLVVSLLMKNIWGESVERWVDLAVALSALGNVLAVSFSQGRVNQELGKQGVLPLGSFWASNRPYNAPLAGLGLHWLVCVLVIVFVPSGDGYNFVVNMITYPLAVINTIISFGLLYLFFSQSSAYPYHRNDRWSNLSPFTLFSAAFFGTASLFLVTVPLMKPPSGAEPYEHLPYWTHVVGGWGGLLLGAVWWMIHRRSRRGD